VKLNDFLSQFTKNEITVYAVSPASPAEHAKLKKLHNLDYTFITDVQLLFPSQFGFYDPKSQSILRGFLGINPETEKMVQEPDFPFGNQAEEILEIMENL
jgi:peroxiredoxin